MPVLFAFHEVDNGQVWANAWKKRAKSRHEMFAKIGVKCRNFRDPNNPNVTGVLLDVPDMKKFESFMQSDEAKKAMKEDGLKVATLRILGEFTP